MPASGKIQAVGKKFQVWRGTALHTSGGLTKSDLMLNKDGKVVSKKKHAQGKKQFGNLTEWNKVCKQIKGSSKSPSALTAAMKKAKSIYHKK